MIIPLSSPEQCSHFALTHNTNKDSYKPVQSIMSDFIDIDDQSSTLATDRSSDLQHLDFARSDVSLASNDSDSQAPPPDRSDFIIDWSRASLQNYEPPGLSTRERKAWHWGHGFEVRHRVLQKKGWACKYCYQASHVPQNHGWIYLDGSGSGNITDHLKNRHNTDKGGKLKKPEPLLESFRKAASKTPRDSEIYHRLVSSFDKDDFKNKLLRWIIQDDVPFDVVNSRFFRDLLMAANDALDDNGLIPGEIHNWIIKNFGSFKGVVTEKLATTQGQIHISFDMWTSRNQLCLCGIIVHFIDVNGKMFNFLLSIPEVLGRHSGANIAETVEEIVHEYNIQSRVGYFVTDNAGNNDTALDLISEELDFNAKHRRLRCMGHILNLVARSILFGSDPDALQMDTDKARQNIDEVTLWRRHGPIGKLHNTVKYVFQSPQRLQRFHDIQKLDDVAVSVPAHLQGTSSAEWWNLERDNDTRWNSTYNMIERALQLKEAVERFIDQEIDDFERNARRSARGQIASASKRPSIVDDNLSSDDWFVLTEYKRILEPLWEATMMLEGDAIEGRNGAIWEVLPAYEFILQQFYDLDERYKQDPEENAWNFHTSLQLGIQKLDDYYRLLDETPAYLAAVVLHPQLKWQWIEKIWSKKKNGKKWIRNGRAAVEDLWSREYKTLPIDDQTNMNPPPAKRVKSNSRISQFMANGCNSTEQQLPPNGLDDDYDWYISQSQVPKHEGEHFNPIQWWQSMRKWRSRLSRMALDLLSIPAMSAKAERIFSHGGNIIRPNRASLKPNTVAAAICLKQWDSEGVIEWKKTSSV